MEENKMFAFGWIIGWFVMLSPFHYYFPHGIIWSLLYGIIGVAGAIFSLRWRS